MAFSLNRDNNLILSPLNLFAYKKAILQKMIRNSYLYGVHGRWNYVKAEGAGGAKSNFQLISFYATS